jgi:hypothetical protein
VPEGQGQLSTPAPTARLPATVWASHPTCLRPTLADTERAFGARDFFWRTG